MYPILSKSPLFRGVSPEEIEKMMSQTPHVVRNFSKGQLIAQRNEEVKNLCIVVEGSVKGEMADFSGKILKIEEMHAPMPIAHAFIFGEHNQYPVDVVALDDCRILYIPKADFLSLMQRNATVLMNYLNAISNRAQFLSNKLWFLSFKTIKEKIAHYLLNLSRNEANATLELPKSQQELAEFFGVTRPALARVFSELETEEIISIKRREVVIRDRGKLLRIIS
jgi:CRP-like cAMP-binding protein